MDRGANRRRLSGRHRDTQRGTASAAVPIDVERLSAHEILALAIERLGPSRVALAASFSAECMVILDLLREIGARPRVFVVDTGRLPRATYELIDRASAYFGLDLEVYRPDAPRVERMVSERGKDLFYRSVADREMCCQVRRLEPLERALAGVDGWITGLRREESPARAATAKIAADPVRRGIWKIAPLADWTSDQVWRHVWAKGLPSNPLYDAGYKSIGCDPCTRAVADGDDPRSGRWWWEADGDRECGMHRAPTMPAGQPPGGASRQESSDTSRPGPA